jgi:hypothetical protein
MQLRIEADERTQDLGRSGSRRGGDDAGRGTDARGDETHEKAQRSSWHAHPPVVKRQSVTAQRWM